MARLYDNLVNGALSVELSFSDTTMVSTQLSSLIEVSGGDTVTITLDPLNEQNGSEIIHVTAHTSGAATATIVREAEASTEFPAKIHPIGTNWVHGVTALDLEGFREHANNHKPGGSDPLEYTHSQVAPLDTWVVAHNLGKRPSVTVVDSSNREVVGDVLYDSNNQITITFSGAFSGTAYLT